MYTAGGLLLTDSRQCSYVVKGIKSMINVAKYNVANNNLNFFHVINCFPSWDYSLMTKKINIYI